MTEIKASDNINVLVPENDQQELWQMSGRVNALHDWIASEAGGQYFSDDLTMVCAVMGFTDILKARAERYK